MPTTARKTAAPAKRSPRKAAPVAATTTDEVPETSGATTEGERTRVAFALVQGDDTKSYAKFTPPADSGCVGTLYVPLGTEEVKVAIFGPAE
jgi:hypothetical protein